MPLKNPMVRVPALPAFLLAMIFAIPAEADEKGAAPAPPKRDEEADKMIGQTYLDVMTEAGKTAGIPSPYPPYGEYISTAPDRVASFGFGHTAWGLEIDKIHPGDTFAFIGVAVFATPDAAAKALAEMLQRGAPERAVASGDRKGVWAMDGSMLGSVAIDLNWQVGEHLCSAHAGKCFGMQPGKPQPAGDKVPELLPIAEKYAAILDAALAKRRTLCQCGPKKADGKPAVPAPCGKSCCRGEGEAILACTKADASNPCPCSKGRRNLSIPDDKSCCRKPRTRQLGPCPGPSQCWHISKLTSLDAGMGQGEAAKMAKYMDYFRVLTYCGGNQNCQRQVPVGRFIWIARGAYEDVIPYGDPAKAALRAGFQNFGLGLMDRYDMRHAATTMPIAAVNRSACEMSFVEGKFDWSRTDGFGNLIPQQGGDGPGCGDCGDCGSCVHVYGEQKDFGLRWQKVAGSGGCYPSSEGDGFTISPLVASDDKELREKKTLAPVRGCCVATRGGCTCPGMCYSAPSLPEPRQRALKALGLKSCYATTCFSTMGQMFAAAKSLDLSKGRQTPYTGANAAVWTPDLTVHFNSCVEPGNEGSMCLCPMTDDLLGNFAQSYGQARDEWTYPAPTPPPPSTDVDPKEMAARLQIRIDQQEASIKAMEASLGQNPPADRKELIEFQIKLAREAIVRLREEKKKWTG